MHEKDILENLEILGFSKKEANVYLSLLKLGEGKPNEIAKEAKVERTTVYKILEDITVRGLARRTPKGKRLFYVADKPEVLLGLARQHKEAAEKILPKLKVISQDSTRKPKIELYHNKENIKRLVMESLKSKEKLRRDFASTEHIRDLLGDTFIERYIEKRTRHKIHLRSLRHKPKSKKNERPCGTLEPITKICCVRYVF